jgi:type IV secretion system protein VirB9
MPAIFVVDKQGKESLANSRMRGQYVVIERLARQFSLRNGKTVSCVFNDHFI